MINSTSNSRRVVLTSLAALLVACAGSNGQVKSSNTSRDARKAKASVADKASAEAEKREINELEKQPMAFDVLTGEVEASDTVQLENFEDSLHVTIPIGTGSPVDCLVYKDDVNAAATLQVLSGDLAKVADIRGYKTIEVSRVGEHVAVFVDIQYVLKEDAEKHVSTMKTMFFEHPVTPMLCMHNEAGYVKSFARIATGFASSLKVDDVEEDAPKLVEIYVDKINGQPAGFSRREIQLGEKGNLISSVQSAMFIPGPEQKVEMQDTTQIEIWDSKGRLLEAAYAEAREGDLKLGVIVKKAGPQAYKYEGTKDDRDFSGKFKTKDKRGLASGKMLSTAIAGELLAGKSAEARFEEYRPAVNVEAPVEVVYTPESTEQRRLKIKVGETAIAATADEKGLVEKIDVPVGSVTATRERIFVRGSE
jgi:hypothetical protein